MAKHYKDKADQDKGTFSGELNQGPRHSDGSPDMVDWSQYPPMPEAPSQKYDK